jgi:hypothetical protein
MKYIKNSLLVLLCLVCSFSAFSQARTFKYANTGGPGTDQELQFLVDSVGNNYVLGKFRYKFNYLGNQVVSLTDSMSNPNEPYILKTNSNGQTVYLKSFVGVDKAFQTGDYKMAINQKGELAVFLSYYGQKTIRIGQRDIQLDSSNTKGLVAKFSKSGFLQWVKPVNASLSVNIYMHDIKLDEVGNVYLTGDYVGDTIDFGGKRVVNRYPSEEMMFLTKYTNESTVDWATSCTQQGDLSDSGSIYANVLELGADGNVYVLGSYYGTRTYMCGSDLIKGNGTYYNAYIASFSQQGVANWGAGCIGDESSPVGVSANSKGEVIFTCIFNSASYSIQGNITLAESGVNNLVAIKFANNGTYEWLSNENTDYISGNAVATIDDSSNIYLAYAVHSDPLNQIRFKKFTNPSTILWEHTSESTDNVNFNGAIFDRQNQIYFNGSTSNVAPFTIGTKTITNDATYSGYGSSFFGRINSEGLVDYIYNSVNTYSSNVDIKLIGAAKYGGCYFIGTYTGSGAVLEEYDLGVRFDNGMFLSQYNYSIDVSGKVKNLSGQTIPEGQVKLIGYTYRQKSPISDSTTIQADGSYLFNDVPLGKYLLVASTDYENAYLPTYYVSAGHWSIADHLEILEPTNRTDVDIMMISVEAMLGSAELSGNVSATEEDDVFKSTMQKPQSRGKANLARGRPKSDWDIIATTDIDEFGNFGFSNVPGGDYTVLIDIPGLPHIGQYLVGVVDGQFYSSIDYLVGEETITPQNNLYPLAVSNASKAKTFTRIYPNPSSGIITIEVPKDEAVQELIISDIQGKTLKRYSQVSSKISLSEFKAGIYFAHITTNERQETLKFIIKP